ncbi:MAG: glycerophosphodiester phosphodiesterase family protein [Pyrinomonadaceae bacterium]
MRRSPGGSEEILLHHRIATRKIIAAHKNNMVVSVWTVDDPRWIARARDLRLHALITNCPAVLSAA